MDKQATTHETRAAETRQARALRGAMILWLCLMGAVFLGACGDNKADNAAPGPVVERCTKTEARFEASVCRTDAHCACGAYCTLGLCALDCASDADCGEGDVCGDDGRCASVDGAPFSTPVAQGIEVSTPLLRIAAPNLPYFVQVRPDSGRGEGPIRAVALGETLLWCPGDADPSAECMIDTLGTEGVEIALGLPENAAEGQVLGAELINTANQITAIRVNDGLTPEPGASKALDFPLEGTYAGEMHINEGGGLTGALSLDGAPSLAALSSPITIAISTPTENSAVLVIEEPAGWILPQRGIVVRASIAEDDSSVQWPRTSLLSDDSLVVSRETDGELTFGDDNESLTMDLTLTLEESRLDLTLTLDARRLGPLSDDHTAPDLTADSTAETPKSTDRFKPGTDHSKDFFATLLDDDGALTAPLSDPLVAQGLAAREQSICDAVADHCEAMIDIISALDDTNAKDLCQNVRNCDGTDTVPCAWQIHTPVCPGPTRECHYTQILVNDCGAVCCDGSCQDFDPTPTGNDLGPPDTRDTLSDLPTLFTPTMVCSVVTEDSVALAVDALCSEGEPDGTPAAFADALAPRSGAPLCADTAAVSEAMTALSDATPDNALTALQDLTDRCEVDLLQLSTGGGLDFGDTEGCLASARLLAALDLALQPTRFDAADATSQTLALYLVQVIAHTQALLAGNALSTFREALAIQGQDNSARALELLEASRAPFAIVLDPRVAATLLDIDPEHLAVPDFRPHLGLPNDLKGPDQGLPIALLLAVNRQLEALDAVLERAHYSGNALDAVRAAIGDTMRAAALVTSLSEALHNRASGFGTLEWAEFYESARLEYVTLSDKLRLRLDDIDSGQNPLGITDDAVQILFPSDLTDPRERFSTTSRFLIGTGAGSPTAPLPVAITTAQDKFDRAQAAWRISTDRELDSERSEEALVRRYGELITGSCGGPIDDPSFDVNSFNVLDRPLDTETCFLEPECRGLVPLPAEEPGAFDLGTLAKAEIANQLCIAGGLKRIDKNAVDPGGLNEALNAANRALDEGNKKDPFPFELIEETRTEEKYTYTIDMKEGQGQWVINAYRLGSVASQARPKVERKIQVEGRMACQALRGFASRIYEDCIKDKTQPSLAKVQAVVDKCAARRMVTLEDRPVRSPATCQRTDDCKRGDVCVGSTAEEAGQCEPHQIDPLDTTACYYDGALSEQTLAVRTAALDVRVAQEELNEFADRYEIAREGCILIHTANNRLENELESFNSGVATLDGIRLAAASVAHIAGGVKDCANSVQGGSLTGVGTTTVACGAAAAETAANVVVEGMDFAIRDLERNHEEAVLRIENGLEEDLCYNDAELELVGIKATKLRIVQAMQNQVSATINLRSQKSYTAALWAEGNTAIANERARKARAMPSRNFLSQSAEDYIESFRYAQRLTFLAVRAVEYEFQTQLQLQREAALTATLPSQLEDIVRDLAAFTLTNTIGGSAPTERVAVVSLRDNLMQLHDLSDVPNGRKKSTAISLFRAALQDTNNAVYNDDGDWIGQRIPFLLQPLEQLGLGTSEGSPILSQSGCAERLWSVNAAVLTAQKTNNDISSFTSMELHQSNTFSSQWCTQPEGADDLQTTTVQPAINLLASYELGTLGRNPSASATQTFARAQLGPYLNVTRAEFETGDFSQGSSTQLAGRGLFAQYHVFIPRNAISTNGSPGLDLSKVQDILLRFDHVLAASP